MLRSCIIYNVLIILFSNTILCLFSQLYMQPDSHQNRMDWSIGPGQSVNKMSPKPTHNMFALKDYHKQTNRQDKTWQVKYDTKSTRSTAGVSVVSTANSFLNITENSPNKIWSQSPPKWYGLIHGQSIRNFLHKPGNRQGKIQQRHNKQTHIYEWKQIGCLLYDPEFD